MIRNTIKYENRFVSYIRRTIINKICAITLIFAGVASMKVSGDGTFLVLSILIGTPLFFANRNCIF